MEGNEGVPAVEKLVDVENNDEEGEEEVQVGNEEERALVVAAPAVGRTPFELLIPEAMTYLVGFVELPTRIKLAAASTTLARLIYRQCSPAWETIELSDETLSWRMTVLITDDVLATLFHRVNAQTVTKILILVYCSSISERCLEPLQESRVLERLGVDAIGDYSRESPLFLAASINVLRTMLPYNLAEVAEVRLPFTYTDEDEARSQAFYHEVRQAVHQRAIDRGTKCTACRRPVRETLRQLVPDFRGLPLTRCYTCRKNFCRTPACPMKSLECCRCPKVSCDECDSVRMCDKCPKALCTECGYFSGKCIHCNKQSCWWMCRGEEITCGWWLRENGLRGML